MVGKRNISAKLVGLLLVFYAAALSQVQCLFEDQAGTYDWRQQYVGRPIFSHIDPTTNKFFVATDQNLIAALNTKNGNIAWRKIFESNQKGRVEFVLWGLKEILVVSSAGMRVQAFSYVNGFANWEYVLFNGKPELVDRITGIESKHESETYYLTNGVQLCYLSLKDKACVDLPSDGGFVYTKLFESERGVFVVGIKEASIQIVQYNSLLTAILSKSQSANNGQLNWLQLDSNCVESLDSNTFVCFSAADRKIYVTPIKVDSSIEFSELNAPSALFGSPASPRLVCSANGNTFVFQTNNEIFNEKHKNLNLFILKLSEQELILTKAIYSVANYEIKLKEKSLNEHFLIYAKYKETNELTLNALSLKNPTDNEHLVNVVSTNTDIKSILHFEGHLMESKGNQRTLSSLVFFEDYSLNFYNSQGVKQLSREEGLAYISSVEMVDFPLLHLQEEFEDEFGSSQQDNLITMFLKRIRTQLFQLNEFLTITLYQKLASYLNSNAAKRSASGVGSASSSSAEIIRDEFNLNKLVVVSTSIGKVFGLYTGANGKILWSFYLKNTKPFKWNKVKNEQKMPLYLQRTAAHFPYEPQCALIAKQESGGGASQTTKNLVFYFNPLTGQPSKDSPDSGILLDYEVQQAFLSNAADAHFLKPLIVLDHENILHVLSDTSAQEFSAGKKSVLYLASDNEKGSSLTGYAMSFSGEPLAELWKVSIEDEKIIAIGSKSNNDRIHSHGKVLGDRSVLYKYLNPNLVGVVTTGQDSQKVPFVNVYLVDTVTGAIINSFNHKRCRGPVHIVHSENWFFYSYYNIKYRRFEVSSVELFEGSTQFNSTHFSSLDDIKPVVFSKSYIVQKSFDAMQITLTEKGISTKDIIVACQFGTIIEIPWILIDPRRPIKMTEVEKEENLIPYMPEIPLNYEFSLNYYNYVYNIRGISTAPTGLESTSLVFVFGLDIFFTRVFPSKTFDMLREDFDYFFITTLLVGLLLGAILSKKLASASNLKKAWK